MPPVLVETGEFAGWKHWPGDPFENRIGPFYFRQDEQGPVCAFRAEAHHMNGMGSMHGGCLMSFADFALFAIAHDELDNAPAVTVAFSSEFLGASRVGQWIEARGDVLRAGRSIIFVRGVAQADGKPILNFSGTLMRVGKG